eukprot:944419-Pelagomonas_calceolata.AAC.1
MPDAWLDEAGQQALVFDQYPGCIRRGQPRRSPSNMSSISIPFSARRHTSKRDTHSSPILYKAAVILHIQSRCRGQCLRWPRAVTRLSYKSRCGSGTFFGSGLEELSMIYSEMFGIGKILACPHRHDNKVSQQQPGSNG